MHFHVLQTTIKYLLEAKQKARLLLTHSEFGAPPPPLDHLALSQGAGFQSPKHLSQVVPSCDPPCNEFSMAAAFMVSSCGATKVF